MLTVIPIAYVEVYITTVLIIVLVILIIVARYGHTFIKVPQSSRWLLGLTIIILFLAFAFGLIVALS